MRGKRIWPRTDIISGPIELSNIFTERYRLIVGVFSTPLGRDQRFYDLVTRIIALTNGAK